MDLVVSPDFGLMVSIPWGSSISTPKSTAALIRAMVSSTPLVRRESVRAQMKKSLSSFSRASMAAFNLPIYSSSGTTSCVPVPGIWWGVLVVKEQAGSSGPNQFARGTVGGQCSAVTIVGIDDERDVHRVDQVPDDVDDLSGRGDTEIRMPS